MSKYQIVHNQSGLLTLAAFLLTGLTVPALAQNPATPRIAPERHFTVPPDVPTALVLQTAPDAACDLHLSGVNDPSQTMRLYGNIEGYVKFHFTPKQDVQDVQLQLECTTPAAVTTHPVHLRIADSPTQDMPAPESSVPAPKGSKILPALTEEAARQLSDEDVISRGYLPRPNAAESLEEYAKWLDRVSRPITILPPHSVSRSDISHTRNVEAGPSSSSNWSGFVAQATPGSYRAVEGEWRVPFVLAESGGTATYSSVWVGLDGYGLKDLVQCGTEQDAVETIFGTLTNYYAWTEVVPNQLEQEVFSVNSSDLVFASVFVGDSKGNIDPSGGYAWFNVTDYTSGQSFVTPPTALGRTHFNGSTAEWIVERPCLGNCNTSPILPELANYGAFGMISAYVLPATGTTMIPYSKAENVQLSMRENYTPQPDNNVLSTVGSVSGHATWMNFFWKNFH
jgi:hypothetical protein